mmetsp:Transcript_14792/g.29218  ORF Transcript_14792/g.29218 Transcript_14792/m.29218 type:complete len:414 (-) Transcript_14792:128-1369(-)
MLGQTSRSVCRAAGGAMRKLQVRSMATKVEDLKRTLIYDEHLKMGGSLVDFADYAMPVQYKDSPYAQSIIESTAQVRQKAGLFDVSHMCSLRWRGKDAIAFVESCTVLDIEGLPMGKGSLSLITNEEGGIIDDTMITKTSDDKGEHIYQVINAGCAPKDLAHFKAKLADFKGDVSMEVQWDDRGLFALQGPKAAAVLQKHVKEDLTKMGFGDAANMVVAGMPCFVARCGYTGEDGFEIFVPGKDAVKLWQLLCAESDVKPSGLGARDALRLEAGLCLYGHDIDGTTTPSEAGLTWTVSKARRESGARKFPGSEKILAQIANPKTEVKIARVGLVPKGAPAREGALIKTKEGETVGRITSGASSPTLKHNISQGYVNKPHNKAGTELFVEVRGKSNPAIVTKMPFVPTNYYKPA